VTLLTRIWEVWGSYLGEDTGHPGEDIPWFPLVLAFTNSLFNKHLSIHTIQSDSGGKINILVVNTCHGKKNVNTNKYLIPSGYWDRAVWIWCVLFVTFLFVGLDEERTLQKKGGYTRRIARSRSGCYCPQKRNVKINTGEQQRHLHTRDAKCTEADGGIFAQLSRTVTNLSFLSNKLILYTYDVISHYCIFLCWILPWEWPEKRPKHVGGLPNVCTLLYQVQCSCWNIGRHGDLSDCTKHE
jgi:hypothetical protein